MLTPCTNRKYATISATGQAQSYSLRIALDQNNRKKIYQFARALPNF